VYGIGRAVAFEGVEVEFEFGGGHEVTLDCCSTGLVTSCLLCSIAFPTKPPIIPPRIARRRPKSKRQGQRVHFRL